MRINGSNSGYTKFRGSEGYWLLTPFASFPFTSPPVHQLVPSRFNWILTADKRLGASRVGAPTSSVDAVPRGNSISAVVARETTQRITGAVLGGKKRRGLLQSRCPSMPKRAPPPLHTETVEWKRRFAADKGTGRLTLAVE